MAVCTGCSLHLWQRTPVAVNTCGSVHQGWPGRDGSRTRAPRPAPRAEIRAPCSAPRRAPGLARSSCETGPRLVPLLWQALGRVSHLPFSVCNVIAFEAAIQSSSAAPKLSCSAAPLAVHRPPPQPHRALRLNGLAGHPPAESPCQKVPPLWFRPSPGMHSS